MVDVDVYVGSPGVPEEGLTHKVVIQLLEPPPDNPALALGKGYYLFIDNFYTSGTPKFLMLSIAVCQVQCNS